MSVQSYSSQTSGALKSTNRSALNAMAPLGTPNIDVNKAVKKNKSYKYSTAKWKEIQAAVGATADGIPGPNTARAVAAFQARHGLVVDGMAGAKTYAKVKSLSQSAAPPKASTPKPAQPGTPPVSFDVNGAVARNKAMGYSRGKWKHIQSVMGTIVDGDPGPKTARAAAAFQAAHGLVADGIVGQKTCAKIGSIKPFPKDELGTKPSDPPSSANPSEKGGIYSGINLISGVSTDKSLLHPRLRGKIDAIEADLAAAGSKMKMFEGFRSWKRQDDCFKRGASKLRGGYGNHNYGMAVDFVRKDGGWSWDIKTSAQRKDWDRFGQIARNHGLTWGGDWTSFVDKPHVELKGIPRSSVLKGQIEKLSGNYEARLAKLWTQY